MEVSHPQGLKPRKTPRQARSEATVDAIFEATIQVLLVEGGRRLTTTQVAERAGVSVGTLYQYFPHKQALLYAVLQHHLGKFVTAVESACLKLRNESIACMAEGLVDAYIDAKARRPDASRALYMVAAELDTSELLGGISTRLQEAATTMLTSVADAKFEDLPDVTFTLLTAMAGATKAVFERGAQPRMIRVLRVQLVDMCQGYLQIAANGKFRS